VSSYEVITNSGSLPPPRRYSRSISGITREAEWQLPSYIEKT
jgi:hypothetical protein